MLEAWDKPDTLDDVDVVVVVCEGVWGRDFKQGKSRLHNFSAKTRKSNPNSQNSSLPQNFHQILSL